MCAGTDPSLRYISMLLVRKANRKHLQCYEAVVALCAVRRRQTVGKHTCWWSGRFYWLYCQYHTCWSSGRFYRLYYQYHTCWWSGRFYWRYCQYHTCWWSGRFYSTASTTPVGGQDDSTVLPVPHLLVVRTILQYCQYHTCWWSRRF